MSAVRPSGALIFDFDGVIADSEVIANDVLAQLVSEAGHPTSLADSLARYCGRRWADVKTCIETDLGKPLADDFQDRLLRETLDAFSAGLSETPGASDFIRSFASVPRCIASSSAMSRLTHCLDVLGIADLFQDRVVSADMALRGKPAPDIFLLAACRLGVQPRHCLVFEDSAAGVLAGCAAGMTVVGFVGGGHVRPDHADMLRAAGAQHVTPSWDDAARLTTHFLQNLA